MSNITVVNNLATGEELSFSLPIRPALIAAREQSRGNFNTWTYPKAACIENEFVKGKKHGTLALGDFCSKPEEETRVIFREYKNGEIIALFPDLDEGSGRILSYVHQGQHGAADYDAVVRQTSLACPRAYHALLIELRDVIGYELKVISRRPR